LPRELINANITHVSYVDKGANKKQFFFTKSDKQPDFNKEIKLFINKEDEEQQLVYGVVYEPDAEDSHGDYMTAAEIEKAAHGFLKDARNIDKQHDFNPGVGEVVESYIAPADFAIGEETIKKGSWVLVTKASDEVWDQIKKGQITGYSMAGTAETVQKQNKKQNEKPVSKSNEENDEEMKGFFNLLKSFFSGEKIQKGEVADKYKRNRKRREFWAAQDALNYVIFNWEYWDSEIESDPDKIREALQDFVNIAQEVLTDDDIAKSLGKPPETIQKAGKKFSAANMNKIKDAHAILDELINQDEEEDEVKKEDIEKMLDEKLNPITKRLDDIEKEDGGGNDDNSEDDVMKQFSEVLDQKLDPITKRLEIVEKARGFSNQADTEPTNVQKNEGPSYMRHFN
jgi:Putative phage serine protease XkdF